MMQFAMNKAINSMMIDMLAAIARKDHQNRRRRQAEGIKKAKEEGKYRGQQAASDSTRKDLSATSYQQSEY